MEPQKNELPLSKLIKMLMIMQEKNVKGLAKKLNITPAYLSLIINGKKKNHKILMQICKELGITPIAPVLCGDFNQDKNSGQEINTQK